MTSFPWSAFSTITMTTTYSASSGRCGPPFPPGGTVLVAEPMAGMRGAETVGAAYFSLYLLAMGQGRPREPGEYRDFLARAGFRRIRSPRPRSPVLTGVITARS
jgi:demethylspheroidene O-methyltransferase